MCTITTPPHARPSQVFVKRIIASDYIITKKDWPDLRRTLMYARTEVRLYAELFPMMLARGFESIPHAYLPNATYVAGSTTTSEPRNRPIRIWITHFAGSSYVYQGGVMILASRKTHTSRFTAHAQCQQFGGSRSPARCGMARCGLAGNRSRALEPVQSLATRNPKELVGMVDAWQRFSTAFAEPLRRANLVTDRVQQLGHPWRGSKHISDQVSPAQ
jgi:hypothetical protein